MKVFLSHQSADSPLAARIAYRLKAVHSIDSYLDVIDPYLGRGEDLADHIRAEMGRCTQLLAVVSQATAASQWVPWEIGVATEKDFPLATFSGGTALPPEFLRKWPYMRTDAELDEYARVSKTARSAFVANKSYLGESVAHGRSTKAFYRDLRAALRQ
nr:toll/interleukin-1 receptor domain-containing protein [uncultured Brevundimonas sp.]